MNKTKKIAIAAVSLVMAGSMALGIVGCGGSKDTWEVAKDENGKLTYTDNAVTLNLNIGNKANQQQGIAFTDDDLSGAAYLPDGQRYTSGSLKPAWQAVSDQLKIKLTDGFTNLDSNVQITDPVSKRETAKYDMISGSLQAIVENSGSFINLADYLDYMPNYKAFLQANPVTRYSLTGDIRGGMYAAPYFDGNDDIEKYTMLNLNVVKDVLDGQYDSAVTYKEQLDAKKAKWATTTAAGKALGEDSTKAYATAYMGQTGSYTVKTTPLSGSGDLVDAKVDYNAALADAKDSSTELGAAISAAAGTAYTGTSGNIVDLQNFAIEESDGAVTGAQLAKILVEYIDAAYTVGGTSYAKAEDVFLSASAAWDVDLFVALSRAAISGSDKLLYGVAGRETTTQRRVDLLAFAGELYGIRGMESRYEYAYFDKDGQLQDARADEDTYTLLSNMSNLTKEGIVYIGGLTKDKDGKDAKTSMATDKTSGERTLALHDYVQTQTKPGLKETDKTVYDFEPIITAVSKWDPDCDGTRDTYMRFTESWRSVKNTGFAIPKEAVKNNPEKLSAVLTLIDYMFSPDGQLVLSYGTQSTNGNTANPNGWWYATESSKTLASVADVSVEGYGHVPTQYTVKTAEKASVFVYNGKVLEGRPYADRNIPIVTDINDSFYKGNKVTVQTADGNKEIKQNDATGSNIKINQVGNYTNYARYFIGSTLPVGNKDQGYEFQASAQCGIDGANLVNVAIRNGSLQHVKLTLASGESPWYLIVPTALPLTSNDQNIMKNAAQTNFSKLFYNNSSVGQIFNVALDMLYYGLGADVAPCGATNTELGATYKTTYDTGAKLVTKLNDYALTQRLAVMRGGWKNLNSIFELGYNL